MISLRNILSLGFLISCSLPVASESVCYGTPLNGRLENGVQLPSSGKNFTSYSFAMEMVGRTYVHSKVRDITVDAYNALYTQLPDKVYKYAETGLKAGGEFKPHKTHRNGLSIDFMVPVLDKNGKSVHLPTNALNSYGYDIEFDDQGKTDDYTIDFEALGAHLVALHKASLAKGSGIWRVIFCPKLTPKLYKTKYGDYIKKNIHIPNKESWVRHDEHFHVDFSVKCKPL